MVRPGNAIQTFQPILPYRQLGSPFIRLTGDEFCSTAESSLYLLENINSAIGGTALTNNSATFALDVNYGNTVAVLSGSTQYLSLPTEASIEVGSGSFLMSMWFKTSTVATMYLVSYGSQVAGKAYWSVNINSSKLLNFLASDGTNTAQIVDPIAGRWQDGLWHNLEVLIDRTSNICYLIVDGIFCNSGSISTLGSLTQAGESLYFGAVKGSGGTVGSFFTGSLANFHLIKAADYNAVGVLNQGIREPVCSGTTVAVSADSNQRFNNNVKLVNNQNEYSYCLINSEAGLYEIQELYLKNTNAGIAQIQINGKTVATSDHYGASLTYNNSNKTYNVPLTEGQNLVKVISSTKNASSSGYIINYDFINFIKRRGHEEGGIDNFLLLGDEYSERTNSTGGLTLTNNTAFYYDNNFNQVTPAINDYSEGTLFIKGGLYRIDLVYNKDTDRGIIDIWFGNVQAIAALDTYNGSSSANQISTVYVRLNQGRQDVRIDSLAKNASSSNYRWLVNSIRGVRLSD